MGRILLSLVLLVFISSCGVRKSRPMGFGGAFQEGVPGESEFGSALADGAEKEPIKLVKDSAWMPDSPILASTFAWSKTPIYVDSIPPDSLRNKADKQLYLASLDIEEANTWRKKRWPWFWRLATLIIPVGALSTYHLLITLSGAAFFFTFYLVLLIALIWLLIIGLLVSITQIPNASERNASRRIQQAVKLAPQERKIEYKVRALLMLSYYYSPGDLKHRAKKLRKHALTDSEKAWMRKLDNLNKPLDFDTKREGRKLLVRIAILAASIFLGFMGLL